MSETDTSRLCTAQTAQFYNAEAQAYDAKRWGCPSGARLNRFQINLVLELLSLSKDDRILEVGTGTGRFAAAVAQGGAAVTGLDVSAGMLEEAARRCAAIECDSRPQFVQGDVCQLPFPDGAFDSVFCINVIQLISPLGLALAEIGRVLKPDGRFVFNFPNLLSPYIVGGLLVNLSGCATGKNRGGRRRSHWFTLGEIKTLLHASSFTIEHVRGQVASPGNCLLSHLPHGLSHPRWLCPSLFVRCHR